MRHTPASRSSRKAGNGLTDLLKNPDTTLEQVLAVTKSKVNQKADRDLTKPDFGDPVDYVIRTDGACPGNPGPMGLGIAVFSNNGESFEKGYSLFIDNPDGTQPKGRNPGRCPRLLGGATPGKGREIDPHRMRQ
jgi:hypothetical protein